MTRVRQWEPVSGPCVPIFVLLLTLLIAPPANPQAQQRPTQSQVESAYLFNFGRFVTWPQEPASDVFSICVLGKDPFGEVLDTTVSGETIARRKIRVERYIRVQDTATCNILFISSSEENRIGPILAAERNSSMLTVSDIPHFAERGGMIGMVEQQGRIRFEVNRQAAEQAHLQLSSELLKVAVKVIGSSGAER